MERLLTGLRAAGEPTRLRLLTLCAHAELSVSELVQILGQSQPRISRHLKLLVEAGLLERHREGVSVFYRIDASGPSAALARTLVDLVPADDPEPARDLARLEQVRARRAEAAAAYFEEVADEWDRLRRLHVPETEVEARLREVVGPAPIGSFLDVGTGTGRILELLADQVERGVGIDSSAAMLRVARARLEAMELRHLQVRLGDMYALAVDDVSVDLATLHLVLHYADEPAEALAEAARTLRPGGRLVVVDFAPHDEEHLRDEHRHRHLGFEDAAVEGAFFRAGLEPGPVERLAGNPLTVNIWSARKPSADRSPTLADEPRPDAARP